MSDTQISLAAPTSHIEDVSHRSIARACEIVLASVGEDGNREGLARTPERFAKAMMELCRGYELSIEDAVGEGVFDSEGHGLVVVKDIEFYSLCEHHMLPFWGKAHIAYYPSRKILGLSKFPRLVEVYARRLQVQERLTREIAEAICATIQPRSIAVKIEASHMCMSMRGVRSQNASTVTEFALGEGGLNERERSRLWNSI